MWVTAADFQASVSDALSFKLQHEHHYVRGLLSHRIHTFKGKKSLEWRKH